MEFIHGEFTQRIPNAIFTSNPCRIQYGTQEIVVLREDILTKMCRNALHFPETDDIPQQVSRFLEDTWRIDVLNDFRKNNLQFAKTLTSQGHLCPLPGEICPIYWPHDHALYLYPLPDFVVVGDRFGGFLAQHMDCTVFNPV